MGADAARHHAPRHPADRSVATTLRNSWMRPSAACRARIWSTATPDFGEWLAGWIVGARRDLPPVDLRGLSAFDGAVYQAVREIGWGDRATYGDIAMAVGRAGGARAVGGAMARCPIFPAVPCHRVVRAADGWSGWGTTGDARKRALLDREQR